MNKDNALRDKQIYEDMISNKYKGWELVSKWKLSIQRLLEIKKEQEAIVNDK